MTEATNTKLMDTEPGGEQTQYEGQSTFLSPSNKQRGQLADPNDPSTTAPKPEALNKPFRTEEEQRERGEQTAENMRFGQAISEQGVGGKTAGGLGSANQGAGEYGEVKAEDVKNTQSRREMGYGGGNDVGA